MQKRANKFEALDIADNNARERQGQWLLITGGVLLGTIGIFVEEANQHPLITVWFRCVFGALALLLLGVFVGRLKELRLNSRGYRVAIIPVL